MPVDFILLDTSVLSEARKTTEEMNESIVAFLRQIPTGAVAVPPAAIFELRRGALILSKTEPVRGKALGHWLDQLLETDIWLPSVNIEVRQLVAVMSITPELAGFWLTSSYRSRMKFGCDPEIAATSIVHGIPIASTDVSDYMRINRFFRIPGLYCPLRAKWFIDPPQGWCLREHIQPMRSDWRRMIGPVDWRSGEDNLDDENTPTM